MQLLDLSAGLILKHRLTSQTELVNEREAQMYDGMIIYSENVQ